MKLRILEDRHDRGRYRIETTHNGWQWSGGANYSLEELKLIRDGLTKTIEVIVNEAK